MSYRTEFPNFDPATLPAECAAWEDVSWRQDTCPSFLTGDGHIVFVDYADPADREIPECERFSVQACDADGCAFDSEPFASDDWAAVLAHLARELSAEMAAPRPCPDVIAYLRARLA